NASSRLGNFEIGLPSSSRASGKSAPIRKRNRKDLCVVIEEDNYIGRFTQRTLIYFRSKCQSPANLSRGNHFRSVGGPPSRVGAIKFTIAEGAVCVSYTREMQRSRGVAQSRFRGMSLMRLLIQSRGCGGVGLRQATRSNEDEDEDEEE
ncbi:hypothetical protein ALC62_06008, partial [Cyphomyrmex costatus]